MNELVTIQVGAIQAAFSADLFQRFIEYTDQQPTIFWIA